MRSLRALLHDLELFELALDRGAQVATLQRIAQLADGSRAVRVCRLGLSQATTPDERARFHGKIADVLLRRNHSEAAAHLYARAAELFAEAEREEAVWGAMLAASIARSVRDPDAARDALLALSRTISSTAGRKKLPWLVRLRLTLGELDLRQGRGEHARLSADNARRLLSLDGKSDDGRIESLAGRAHLALGDLTAAEASLSRAVAWFAEKDDRASFSRLGALEALALVLLETGRMERAQEVLSQAIAMADALADSSRASRIELLRASAFVERNPTVAVRYILRAAERLRLSWSRELATALVELAEMLPNPQIASELRKKLRLAPDEK